MTEQTVIALVAAVGVIGAASVSGIGVVMGMLWRRLARLEHRERATWWWARAIADLYYRYRQPGSPDLPPPPAHEEES